MNVLTEKVLEALNIDIDANNVDDKVIEKLDSFVSDAAVREINKITEFIEKYLELCNEYGYCFIPTENDFKIEQYNEDIKNRYFDGIILTE